MEDVAGQARLRAVEKETERMNEGKHLLLKDRGWCPMECSPWPGQIEPCSDCPYLASGEADADKVARMVVALIAVIMAVFAIGLAAAWPRGAQVDMTEDPRVVLVDGRAVGAS